MKRDVFGLLGVTVLVSAVGLISTQALADDDEGRGWPQWGQNPQHQGFVNVTGQRLDGILGEMTYDPFVRLEQHDNSGDLLAHYQAPLVAGDTIYMAAKTGRYVVCDDNGDPIPPDTVCGSDAWNFQIWNEKAFTLEGGQLREKWSFASDWKPEPDKSGLGGWEPVFHAVVAGDFVYVPGAGGTIFKLDRDDGTMLQRINPFATIDPNTFVTGPLVADSRGNIYYNVMQLDGGDDPWGLFTFAGTDVVGSWLVKVSRGEGDDDSGPRTQIVSYRTLVPGAPTTCTRSFSARFLPWPGPTPNAVAPSGPCGSQRPGVNVGPAIAPDGTIYTMSRAHLNSRYSYVVAVNPNLTPKWAASMRGHINNGCGVLVDIATVDYNPADPASVAANVNKCRRGATLGVDPQTGEQTAGRVIDQSSSIPMVLPDGSVLYGSYTRYNVARGNLFKFSSSGNFLAAYDFGWDQTPAVFSHDGTYSIAIKDNHYDAGPYCNPSQSRTLCVPLPQGPYYITQLKADLSVDFKFRSTNTQSCTRNPDGTLTCRTDHPNGFEWCINAPAIDRNGVIYANSEDGNLYTINPNGTEKQRLFLNLAIGAAYTPLSVGSDGTIYTENDGHLFVVGERGRDVEHDGGGGTRDRDRGDRRAGSGEDRDRD